MDGYLRDGPVTLSRLGQFLKMETEEGYSESESDVSTKVASEVELKAEHVNGDEYSNG